MKKLILINYQLINTFTAFYVQQIKFPIKIYIQKEVPMLENLLEYYRKSDGAKE
jgi:hypothetical protein